MPVTLKTASHGANATDMSTPYFATPPLDLHNRGQRPHREPTSLIQSSFSQHTCQENNLFGSPNCFVYSAIEAYNAHHHLTIRPDDIWFAILSQFGCWLGKAAEEVRHRFVSHEGQKHLDITYASATRYTVDYGDFAKKMTHEIEGNVVDPELRA